MIATNVYLFCGGNNYEGISLESFNGLKKNLSEFFHAHFFEWNHEKHPPSTWAPKSLCVFPGGTCSEWNKILSKTIQEQISNWVSEGGKIRHLA